MLISKFHFFNMLRKYAHSFVNITPHLQSGKETALNVLKPY